MQALQTHERDQCSHEPVNTSDEIKLKALELLDLWRMMHVLVFLTSPISVKFNQEDHHTDKV